MSVVCPHCGALRWRSEKSSFCCGPNGELQGAVPPFKRPPRQLLHLISETGQRGRHFRQNIRAYNSQMRMATVRMTAVEPPGGGFNPTMKIGGTYFHRIRGLYAQEGQELRCINLVVLDTDDQVAQRVRDGPANLDLRRDIINVLTEVVNAHDVYA
eukprot:Plantae.Rhodophyta-Rhodochaete_pulchella.ctg41850.p2 GENE.Plantae.Rhodophyta-Rhodochaete_pulchella.ctg41850~~Plantae.Rhodophyta-Rhodochaete_pulchella.ctg41850.p2  ORF type:complete len:156 (-),score=5.90 Plantae.Rhodophyta-Rhodochaete_pulchella.ctg41850:620-1087(-)